MSSHFYDYLTQNEGCKGLQATFGEGGGLSSLTKQTKSSCLVSC